MVLRHEPVWRQLRHPALVFVVVAAVSAVFWVPLAISLLQAGHVDSQLNRYFNAGHGIPQLPFVEFSPTGLISLIGLFYLVLTARDSLSRALLVFLGGAVLWYLIGLPLALADYPLLTFRGKPLIPIVLFTGGVLALTQLGRMALDRLPNRERVRVRLALVLAGAVFAFIAARGFMVIVVEHRLIAAAHDTALPSGMVPRFAPERTDPPSVSANAIRDVIDSRYAGPDHPVVLSDRADVLAVNPYYGFSQWQVFYAHPAAMFHARIDFLRTLASSESADAFAELSVANPYDAIDAFVLADEGEMLAFHYRDENFPTSTKGGLVEFRRALFDPAAFELVDLGDYVVAVRR
jgi:galactan 5-O-arabinofuranosyltransferase